MNKLTRIVLVTWTLAVWLLFIVAFEAIFEGMLHWPQIVFTAITTLLLFVITETDK